MKFNKILEASEEAFREELSRNSNKQKLCELLRVTIFILTQCLAKTHILLEILEMKEITETYSHISLFFCH